jgi:hypothetical protein
LVDGLVQAREQASAILPLCTFMSKDMLLVVLTATGSAFCWWPVIMQPNLGLPFWWFPLPLVAIGIVVSTTLSDEGWLQFMIASIVGSFVGICGGFWIWWPADRIDAPFVPLVVASATLKVALVSVVSLVAGLALRSLEEWIEKRRQAIWLAFICWTAIGPATVAMTPPLVAYRAMHNERIAAKGFELLKTTLNKPLSKLTA